MKFVRPVLFVLLAGCAASGKSTVETFYESRNFTDDVAKLPRAKAGTIGTEAQKQIMPTALFRGPMPTGLAVSRTGRVFACFPRWGDPVDHTVVEIRNGQAAPYPNDAMTKLDPDHPTTTLVSAQSVVVDSADRLWILDTGSVNFGPVKTGAAKLVAVDLSTNQIIRTIVFPADVALPTSYLNDVRFDLNRGPAGFAYLTDSSSTGSNALIVVDLSTGKSWRRLSDHPSTKAENYTPTVEGRALLDHGHRPTVGVDGIAVAPDGKTIYYCPMVGHHLYTVSADALADRSKSDADVAATVRDLGDRGFASDGLECGPDGTLYLTDYAHNAIRTRSPDGTYAVLCSDARMLWPDSLAIGPGQINPGDFVPPATGTFLHFTCNQLHRRPPFRGGDDRVQPYAVFRVLIGDAERP